MVTRLISEEDFKALAGMMSEKVRQWFVICFQLDRYTVRQDVTAFLKTYLTT